MALASPYSGLKSPIPNEYNIGRVLRSFYFTAVYGSFGKTNSGIHHGFPKSIVNGEWHTIERDLEAELQAFEPNNSILKITTFRIRSTGDVFLDNIIGCDD